MLNSIPKMENISTLIIYTVLCFMRLSAGEDIDRLKFTPVRVIGVKNGVNNSYFDAVEDDSSPTGWAVQVKQDLSRYDIDNYILVYMFDNTPKTTNSTRKFHRFFGTFLCDLLIPDSRFDLYPERNNMPRDIINLIFPERKGSCNLTESTKPILPSANVNTAEYDNPMVRFPNTSYYELTVNILTQALRPDVEDNFLFQVKLAVGNPPRTGRICLGTQWNYYTVWRICTIAEFFESTISGIGWKVLHGF